MLGQKKKVTNEQWKALFRNIGNIVSKAEIDNAIDICVEELKAASKGKRVGFAWSGGKDSIALYFLCKEAGIINGVWVRPMPKFAIRNHSMFRLGMSYQEFGKKIFQSVPPMVGLRVAESIQRRQSIASIKTSKFFYPIYDWRDNDVWLYIKLNNLTIPMTYIYLYKTGVPLNKLRISQFFSIDTIKTLPKVMEFYPDLYERVIRREPNADLVMLYWDTDMFRSSRQDKKFELDKDKDYRVILRDAMKNATLHPDMYPGYKSAKKLYSIMSSKESPKTCHKIYQMLIAGDPKKRTYRSLIGDIYRDKGGGV